MRFLLLAVCASPVLVCGCGLLGEFVATPEGQDTVKRGASGVAGVLANPANVFAWWDLVTAGLTLGGVALGLKGTHVAVKTASKFAKRHVLNTGTTNEDVAAPA